MRFKILVNAAIFELVTLPASAFNIEHLQQLLNTHICQRCDLSGADLRNANLSGVDLSDANLSDADLSGVNFSGADLSRANLKGANLSNANLTNAKLINIILKDANLNNTVGLPPDHLTIPNQRTQQETTTVQPENGHFTSPDRVPTTRGAGANF